MKKIKMFNGSELEVGEKIRFADFEIVAEDEENPVNTLVKITDIR